MAFDLEKSLNETIEEFRKRIEQNPRLGSRVSEMLDYATTLEAKNNFLIHVNLIREMRAAYEAGDRKALDKIPLYVGNGEGFNAVTYLQPILYEGLFTPFSSETSGENVYWVTNAFEELAKAREPTKFYNYLCGEIKQFEIKRNEVRDEIMVSDAYVGTLHKHSGVLVDLELSRMKLAFSRPDVLEDIRDVYREEEFKRKDRVIELCNKAEELYGLASRLFEALRTDAPQ